MSSMLRGPERPADDQHDYTSQVPPSRRPFAAAEETGEAAGTVRDGDGRERRFTTVSWRPGRSNAGKKDRDGWYLLTIAVSFLLLIALAAATMYVSYEAQAGYIEEHKDDEAAIVLEAISWDAAAIVLALLGLATAMRGRSALRARVGNLACVAVSCLMNAAPAWDGADTHWGALLVWVGPPLLYAMTSDTIILEIQQRAMERRNLPVRHASLWSIIGGLVRVVGAVLAWLLRLAFDHKGTYEAFKSWYLENVPYAPGRTAAMDRAEKAELEAGGAQEVAEQVRQESAAEVAAAREEMTQALAEAEERHARELADREEAEQARLAELGQAYEEQVAALREELEVLRSSSGDLDGQLRTLRSELGQERSAREQLEQRCSAEQAQRERQEAAARQAAAEAQRLGRELEAARANLSARQQVELLYDELGRAGDGRHGSYDHLDQVAEEIYGRLEGAVEVRTVRRYLREHLSGAGQVAAFGHDGETAGARVASANGSMIGGA